MCGQDELPWYGRAYMSGNQLIVERAESDSGCVFVPWRIDGRGVLLLGTSTLMERDRPYRLEVELARGTINRLRNQIAHWEMLGLGGAGRLAQRSAGRDATFFARRDAPTSPNRPPRAPSGRWSRPSTRWTVRPRSMPSRRSRFAARSRRSSPPGSASIWATTMPAVGVARQLLPSFNMVSVPLSWRSIEASEGRRNWKQADAQVEWAKTAGMKIMGGPLLELDDRGVPDWTYLWEGDFDSLLGFMLDHVADGREALSRQGPPLASRLADEPRPRARAHRGPAAANRGPGDHQGPRARPVDAADRIVRPAVGRVPGQRATRPRAAPLCRRPGPGRPGALRLGLEITVGYHPGATAAPFAARRTAG